MTENMKSARRGDELSTEPDVFVWDECDLIPRGLLSMIIGRGGQGKSSLLLSLVGLWTTRDKPETVFVSMAEDSDFMIRSRLVTHGADLRRCVFQGVRPDGTSDLH